MPTRIYLDNCCFNRPFDDQSQFRIRLETEAKLEIQRRVREQELELAWSYILDYENQANPFPERRDTIARWKSIATAHVVGSDDVLQQANRLLSHGIRPKDALHLACAMISACRYFLTTDDIMLKKTANLNTIAVVNPTQFIIEARP